MGMKKNIFTNQISRKFRSKQKLPDWLNDLPQIKDQIKLIRETLGMTQQQLGKRTGMSLRWIQKLESGEAQPNIKTLKIAAKALNAELNIFLIPKIDIEDYLNKKAWNVAQKILRPIETSAGLEIQFPSKKEREYQIAKLVNEILEKHRDRLWD